jgi:uncharacterized protein with PIN domain
MAVPCPRCGRDYDVTLFEFGRTIWCSCGSRVGAETRERALDPAEPVRFAADAMLGKLARWLRLLGFDCSWAVDVPDADLVRGAVEAGRIVLTRDRALPEEWRVSGICVLESETTFDQLCEVVRRFDLADSVRLFSRCSACNRELAPAAPADVASRVPARVLAGCDSFRACAGCGRIYWEGSHARRIARVAERVLAVA